MPGSTACVFSEQEAQKYIWGQKTEINKSRGLQEKVRNLGKVVKRKTERGHISDHLQKLMAMRDKNIVR